MNFKNGKKIFLNKYCSIFVLLFFLAGCINSVASHNVFKARRVANDFFENLFIQNDLDSAYSLFNENMKNRFSPSEFKANLMEVHQGNLPKMFLIPSYEIYDGQKTIAIFLTTLDCEPKFYYKVTLAGTKNSGYLVSGFDVSPPNIELEKGNRVDFEVILMIGEL